MKHRVSRFAQLVGLSERAVRTYADLGLIPSERDSSGARLFAESAVPKAKEVRAIRVARRGCRTGF